MRRAMLPLLVLVGLAVGEASAIEATLSEWFAHFEVEEPTRTRITVCHGFACTYRTPHRFPPEFLAALAPAMAAASAADERRAIAAVVAQIERRVAPFLGGPPDRARADLSDAQVAGQMDCLDEATNTTSVLLVLEANGLLRFHQVRRPEARGFFTIGAHATAVIVERASRTAYAVDSWPRPSGALPDVMTLERWHERVLEGIDATAEGDEQRPARAPRR